MKYSVTIVSLLIFTQIQLGLCSKIQNDASAKSTSDIADYDKPEICHQNRPEDSDSEMKVNKKNGSSKPIATQAKAQENKAKTPTSVNEMKRSAIVRRNYALKRARLTLEKVIAKVETLRKNAELEREKATEKRHSLYDRAELIDGVLRRRVSKKFAEAKQRALNEYNQAKSEAEEKFKEATKVYQTALEALDEEFENERTSLQERKQKSEIQHKDVLEKAIKEKETALRLAEEKFIPAKKRYSKARGNGRISKKEEEDIQNEYVEELDKYDEAIELAENNWQKVLDKLGIGSQIKAAEGKLLEKLLQAKENAEIVYRDVVKNHHETLEELEKKLHEANELAEEEFSKGNDECNEIFYETEKERNMIKHKSWRQWRKVQANTEEELNKAKAEFAKAESAAINEYSKTLQTFKEMEKKLGKENQY